jgi:hypothetical protein
MTLVVVLVLISFAGCTYPQGEEVSISFHGAVNETGSGVEIDGELAAGGGIPEQESFEDVSVVLYDENGTVLHSESVGDLDAEGGPLAFTVSVSEQPHYVTFESGDIWDEKTQVEYFVRCEYGYCSKYASERSDLPRNS